VILKQFDFNLNENYSFDAEILASIEAEEKVGKIQIKNIC